MNLIKLKMIFGSHVYGTNLPTSDTDYKAIYIPSAKDILLQRVKGSYSENTKKDTSHKNESDDIDLEIFSLQKYLDLLMQGQTVAIDILFSPDKFILEGKEWGVWQEIKKHAKELIPNDMASFSGYCKDQAAKYGIKGSRINAVRRTLEWVKQFDPQEKLINYTPYLNKFIEDYNKERIEGILNLDRPLIQIVEIEHKKRGITEPYFEVCNRKFSFHNNFKHIGDHLQKIFDEYGHRARMAETNEGCDWKALMHAVRVSYEAKELVLTGSVTFPRPEADLLLKIRKGELPYKKVAELIEKGLLDLDSSMSKSVLKDKPNRELAEELIIEEYSKVVYDYFGIDLDVI